MAAVTIKDYVASGVFANRPTTPDVPSGGSSLYYATDTSTLYVWDEVAGAWDGVSGGGGGGGAFEYVETVTATSATEMDVDLPDNELVMLVYEFQPATDNDILMARVTTDGFTTVKTGATDYKWAYDRFLVNANHVDDGSGTGGDNVIEIAPSIGNASNESARGVINVFDPQNGVINCDFEHKGTVRATDGNTYRSTGFGAYEAITAVDGVRFFFNAGNIATGRVHVYTLVTT